MGNLNVFNGDIDLRVLGKLLYFITKSIIRPTAWRKKNMNIDICNLVLKVGITASLRQTQTTWVWIFPINWALTKKSLSLSRKVFNPLCKYSPALNLTGLPTVLNYNQNFFWQRPLSQRDRTKNIHFVKSCRSDWNLYLSGKKPIVYLPCHSTFSPMLYNYNISVQLDISVWVKVDVKIQFRHDRQETIFTFKYTVTRLKEGTGSCNLECCLLPVRSLDTIWT